MIFIVLNAILTAFLIAETFYVDFVETRNIGKNYESTNPANTNVLLLAIITGMYGLFYLCHGYLTDSLFTLLMRICFVMEGCMLVNIAFCFPYYAWKYTSSFTYIAKLCLYIVVGWFVFFKFKSIKANSTVGIVIESPYVFPLSCRSYFPWTYAELFDIIFKIILPLGASFAMLIKNESSGSKLDKHKGYVYLTGLGTLWILMYGLSILSSVNAGYSLLHYFVYVPILVILPQTFWLKQAPSGRGILSFHIKAVFLRLIPAAAVGFIYWALFVLAKDYGLAFVFIGLVIFAVICFILSLIVKPLARMGSKFIHSADYANSFEKDLAQIDYNGEMDTIANDMYQIFNKNVEASSMSVYINGGNNTFENAYSSNLKKYKIDEYEMLFETLLNQGKNVIIYNELDSHQMAGSKKELEKFFKHTCSDALFILNEGRDVHGIITLGAKAGNDHYKDYDLKVFTKLYSYFFVFGYYMRNISNKEIIGTVNRELRMSSQIITSIQENMDLVKNPKMDAGCIMVPAHNIGGEFVDMIRLTDTRHLFVMGDLSGKGIAASMSMVILKAIIRAYLSETHDFKQLVCKVNQFIRYNLQKGTIFSGMFAIVNYENDTMYYINCGIPAIFLYTEAYNNVIEIQGSGHILGFVKDISPYISVKQVKLHKNDIIMMCTDGLIESHSLRGEQYGKDRIQRAMVANAMYPAQRMARFEYDELVRFMSHEMEDDVSVLVMKYLKDNESVEDVSDSEANVISNDVNVEETVIPETESIDVQETSVEEKQNEESSELVVNEEALPDMNFDTIDDEAKTISENEFVTELNDESPLISDESSNIEDDMFKSPVEGVITENFEDLLKDFNPDGENPDFGVDSQ